MLNAKNHEQEAVIIAQAGKLGAVTVATNMAGRGVDIVLGGNPTSEQEAAKVKEIGGLYVLATDRHEARRIDNQLRGRSGRQGDPGATQFFVSLEDDIMRIFGGERIKGLMEKLRMPEDQPIENKMVSNALESAQSKIEGFHFDARKNVLQYDDILNKHRDAIYRRRHEILEKAAVGEIKEYIVGIVEAQGKSKEDLEKKEQEFGEEKMRQAEKIVALRSIDSLWLSHLEEMDHLRDSVRLRAYGQQDPLVEYKNESRRMFDELVNAIEENTTNSILNAQLAPQHPEGPMHTHNVSYSSPAGATSNSAPVRQTQSKAPASPKIGRNDPCPCGSGLKYKRCGMINAPEHKK